MDVRLFRIGGHDYVFRFGIFRKDDGEQQKPVNKKQFERVPLTCKIPKNKYGYSRTNISKNIGLKRYALIMDKMPEILEYVPVEFTTSVDIITAIKKHVSKNLEITAAILNQIARIYEATPLKDKKGKLWKLVIKNWGVNSLIKKEEVKNEQD